MNLDSRFCGNDNERGFVMLSKINVMKIFFCFFALTLFTAPKLSHADWSIGVGVGDRDEHHDHWRDHHDDWREREQERHFFYYHDHPDYGYRIHYFPDGGYTIWAGGVRYFYYDGLYYIREGYDYVLVNPPIGAYVSAIPPDFQPVSINGRIYYTDNGVYYILTQHHGYKVVPRPVMYFEPQAVVVAQPQQVVVSQRVTTAVGAPEVVNTQDSFPVNIPNGNGSYTTIVIRKSGNGYVGPQGEFYAQFPTVSRLKTMYVK